MLHIVNKSPMTHSTLSDCLAYAQPQDAVLLIENAVYAVLPNTAGYDLIQTALSRGVTLAALQEDLTARGINAPTNVPVIDYSGFVALAAHHGKSQSWS